MTANAISPGLVNIVMLWVKRPLKDNPIFLRESGLAYRKSPPGIVPGGDVLTIITIGAVVISILALGIGAIGAESAMGFAWTITQICLLYALSIPAFTAPSIAGEREQRSWEHLLITPLSCEDIIAGKLFGNSWHLVAVLMVFSPGIIVCMTMHGHPMSGATIVIVLFTFTTACATLGLLASMLASRTWIATTFTYTTLFCLLLLLPILKGMIGGSIADWEWLVLLYTFNPFITTTATPGFEILRDSYYASPLQFHGIPIVLLTAIFYLICAIAMVRIVVWLTRR